MDFKKKFEGKIVIMNKEGIIGLVKRKTNPAKIDPFLGQSRSLSPRNSKYFNDFLSLKKK